MTITATKSPVSFDGVLAAAEVLSAHLTPTPTWRYSGLAAAAGLTSGRDIVVKHENMQPTGAFKVRGGLTLAAQLTADERAAGLVTCSTGNHAQSIAFAARSVGTRAVIVMPECAPEVKVDAVRALGAEVVIEGPTLGEASAHATMLAETKGLRFVDPGNEPAIIHGHATVYLELLTSNPEIDEIYVPIGSGSGAAGACLVRDAIAPHVLVIGVQSEGASAAYESWISGVMQQRPAGTRVSGLATARGCAVPQAVMHGEGRGGVGLGLDDFLLVSDDDIDVAARVLAQQAHTLAEGAGAASLAGLMASERRTTTQPVGTAAIVISGGNVSSGEWAMLAG